MTLYAAIGLPSVVPAPQDPALARLISRWHFELRRGANCSLLRAISDSPTEVDGVPAPRGKDVPILVGSRVGVASTLTLEFLAPSQMDARTQLCAAKPSWACSRHLCAASAQGQSLCRQGRRLHPHHGDRIPMSMAHQRHQARCQQGQALFLA